MLPQDLCRAFCGASRARFISARTCPIISNDEFIGFGNSKFDRLTPRIASDTRRSLGIGVDHDVAWKLRLQVGAWIEAVDRAKIVPPPRQMDVTTENEGWGGIVRGKNVMGQLGIAEVNPQGIDPG